ncbi:MAG: flagellar motor stator protein MotA [Nitrospirae bacterium]|nr:flagellar motor stator protein MotA [Nitrospirota bacterium]
MFAGIGIALVLAAVIGGFLMEGGNLHVMIQPAEYVIIFGAALGAFFIASPGGMVSVVFKSVGSIFGSGSVSKAQFLELLALLNTIFSKIRKDGLISIEADIENPKKSPLFTKYKSVLANHHALDFICDNLKVMITTNMPPHELESLMDVDIGAHHHHEMIPSESITKVADALPGLGIVAAVLGVVLTMGKIDQPPSVLGHSIGAALVGTFLGVLACYGFVGPIATNLENQAKAKGVYFEVIKVAMVAFVGGAAPQMAVELGRRAISGQERPSFTELEKGIRK